MKESIPSDMAGGLIVGKNESKSKNETLAN